jgi:hypothetical protein
MVCSARCLLLPPADEDAQARLRPCWPGVVSKRRWLDVNTNFAKALFLEHARRGQGPPSHLRLFTSHAEVGANLYCSQTKPLLQ